MEQNVKHRHWIKHRIKDRFCVCPECDERIIHKRGIPCQEETCSKCGTKMLRMGSYHYKKWLKEKTEES